MGPNYSFVGGERVLLYLGPAGAGRRTSKTLSALRRCATRVRADARMLAHRWARRNCSREKWPEGISTRYVRRVNT
jgi:hypothetical protein